MSPPRHHPSEALLLAYASGALAENLALVVATHLSLCGACRARNAALEATGGALLAALAPEELGAGALATALARLDEAGPPPAAAPPVGPWPEPLASFAPDGAAWRWIGPGLRQRPVPLRRTAARLLKAAPGARVPSHGHGGLELTLVLRGAYRDGHDRFDIGDLQEVDDAVVHRPRAEPGEDCICLIATERPLRFRHWTTRLFRRFARV
jgi:putative transcriptional regulator